MYVSISNVVAIQSNQTDERSLSFGEPIKELTPLFANGWDQLQGVAAVYELTQAEQKAAIVQRKQDLKQWSSMEGDFILHEKDGEPVKMTYKELAEFSRKLWTEKDEEFIVPKYGANCCYRRLYAITAATAAYQSFNQTDETFDIPAVLKTYPTGKARADAMMIDRLSENAQTGRVGYDAVELLIISIKLVKRGDSEATIRQLLNVTRGTSQKLHALATICNRYDELDLVNRLSMPKPVGDDGKPVPVTYTKGGYVPISKIKAGFARTLLGKASSLEKMDIAAREAMGESFAVAATPEQVEQALKNLITGVTNAPKVMDKDTIARFRDQASSEIARKIFNAILSNDRDGMVSALDELK